MPKQGVLITNNCILKPHEQKTVNFLLSRGHNIELIPTSSIPGARTADIRINGIVREIKAPKGDSEWTIQRNLKRGKHQSDKIILDLYRCKRPEQKAIMEAQKEFLKSKNLKELTVICKDRQVLEYKKK
ncbi:hypothetical protein IK110_00340 [Candidatus Saccharibacteria bacterium]|nr:hypothetical protein [Candidatus Saccharibacteria bacterium]